MSEKLKYNEIGPYRSALLRAQNFICPLCQNPISTTDAVLDHCHVTGRVRGVLHRNCNRVEGKVRYWIKRVRMVQEKDFLDNLKRYYEQDYSNRAIHPKHKK